jgi:hypothetical protein
MWKWDSTLDNRWARVPQCSFLFLKEQLKSIIIIAAAEHSCRNARGDKGRVARNELGEGNTQAKVTEA